MIDLFSYRKGTMYFTSDVILDKDTIYEQRVSFLSKNIEVYLKYDNFRYSVKYDDISTFFNFWQVVDYKTENLQKYEMEFLSLIKREIRNYKIENILC